MGSSVGWDSGLDGSSSCGEQWLLMQPAYHWDKLMPSYEIQKQSRTCGDCACTVNSASWELKEINNVLSCIQLPLTLEIG